MTEDKMFQVSTLQALALGYSKTVITVGELLKHGDTGLGTFEDVNGEMLLTEGHCFRADQSGNVVEMPDDTGVPFTSVAFLTGKRKFELGAVSGIEELKTILDNRIEEDFGLNSMHMVRIDGDFEKISARSEAPYKSHHVTLKEILKTNQEEFYFNDIKGSLICVYYPDYMDGINAPGWHLHFVSDDRKKGGHVFDLVMKRGTVLMDKLNRIEIQFPKEAAFDTYSLKSLAKEEIKEVEQGK